MNWIRLCNFLFAFCFFYNFIAVSKWIIFLPIIIFALKVSDLLPNIKVLAIKLIIYPRNESFHFLRSRFGWIRSIILATHVLLEETLLVMK